MNDIARRLAALRRRVAAAARAAGRDPSEVRLLAASKTVPPERVLEAVRAGQLLFGENRAQELRDKAAAVDALLARQRRPERPEWHFIGPLQTNKVRLVVGRVALVHSVDRAGLAAALAARVRRLAERTGRMDPLAVLVEVNIGREPTKAGVPPERALELCRAIADLEELALRGLMAVPPREENPERARAWFRRVRELAEAGRAEGLPLDELSMGMSADFELAIAEGATIVRVGTALFGPRPRPGG